MCFINIVPNVTLPLIYLAILCSLDNLRLASFLRLAIFRLDVTLYDFKRLEIGSKFHIPSTFMKLVCNDVIIFC